MMKHALALVLAISMSHLSLTSARVCAESDDAEQCEALSDIFGSTNGYAWKNSSNWMNGDTFCSWDGVQCNNQSDVVQLAFSYKNLSGPLLPSISKLKHLTVMSLAGNNITHLPEEVTQLQNLQEIWLENSPLDGIPENIGNMTSLHELDLSFSPGVTPVHIPQSLCDWVSTGSESLCQLDGANFLCPEGCKEVILRECGATCQEHI